MARNDLVIEIKASGLVGSKGGGGDGLSGGGEGPRRTLDKLLLVLESSDVMILFLDKLASLSFMLLIFGGVGMLISMSDRLLGRLSLMAFMLSGSWYLLFMESTADLLMLPMSLLLVPLGTKAALQLLLVQLATRIETMENFIMIF